MAPENLTRNLRARKRGAAHAAALLILLSLAAAQPATAGRIELVSGLATAAAPRQLGEAGTVSMSADGRFVAFLSSSPNLVSGQSDPNGDQDVFLWDRANGEIRLVSHRAGSATVTADRGAWLAQISADGRWIAFSSWSTNLVAGQIESEFVVEQDLFLFDRLSGEVTLVTHASGAPLQAANAGDITRFALSADGRYLAFESHGLLVPGQGATSGLNVFLYDRVAGTSTLVSHNATAPATPANGISTAPAISADGRWVAFQSGANDLITGLSVAANQENAFLWDRTTGTTVLVSAASGSTLTAANGNSVLPRISADGAWIAFGSTATNLIAGLTDGNGAADLFLWERATGAKRLVSRSAASPSTTVGFVENSFALSGDGALVAFTSAAGNVAAGQTDGGGSANVFLFERATGTATMVSHSHASATTTGNGSSFLHSLSGDGSRVLFDGAATNLIAGGTDANVADDLFLWDRAAGTTALISHPPGNPAATADAATWWGLASGDGLSVAFVSTASNLAGPDDQNLGPDVFLYDATSGINTALSYSPAVSSVTSAGYPELGFENTVSGDGRFIVFLSTAPDLVPGQIDVNGDPSGSPYTQGMDVFLYDRSTRTTSLVSHRADSPLTSGDDISTAATISRDGRYVAFTSSASDLVPGLTGAGGRNVYLFDRITGSTILASPQSAALPNQTGCFSCFYPKISPDGRYVAFHDWYTLRFFDRDTGQIQGMFVSENSISRVSDDHRHVAFLSNRTDIIPGQIDTNGGYDLFLHDRQAGTTVLVSRAATSAVTTGNAPVYQGPGLSGDGRFVTFSGEATNYVAGTDSNNQIDAFLFDRMTGTVTLLSHAVGSSTAAGNAASTLSSISRDGRFAAFVSAATDLLPGQVDTAGTFDIFLLDLASGGLSMVSHRAGSRLAGSNQGVSSLALSGDAGRIAFRTMSTDLVAGIDDGNTTTDVYVYDRSSGSFELASRTQATPGETANGFSQSPLISDDGQVLVFPSRASDLVANDFNNHEDLFAFVPEDLDFYTLAPCRIFDTRQPQHGPALVSGTAVGLQVTGSCGVPSTARAVAINVTVFEPTAAGHLRIFQGDGEVPSTSTINFTAGVNRANNANLRLAPSGTGTLAVYPFVLGSGTVHVIIDVTGYYE